MPSEVDLVNGGLNLLFFLSKGAAQKHIRAHRNDGCEIGHEITASLPPLSIYVVAWHMLDLHCVTPVDC